MYLLCSCIRTYCPKATVYMLLPVFMLMIIALHNMKMSMCWQCNGWSERMISFESINEVSHFDKTKNISDRLCINWPFIAKHRNPVFYITSYRTFSDNNDVFLFSIQFIVLKLYDGKHDTIENVQFEKCLFPFPYS